MAGPASARAATLPSNKACNDRDMIGPSHFPVISICCPTVEQTAQRDAETPLTSETWDEGKQRGVSNVSAARLLTSSSYARSAGDICAGADCWLADVRVAPGWCRCQVRITVH